MIVMIVRCQAGGEIQLDVISQRLIGIRVKGVINVESLQHQLVFQQRYHQSDCLSFTYHDEKRST